MSAIDDLTATRQAEAQKQAEARIPKAWRAGEKRNDDGTTDVTSRPYDDAQDVEERQLLEDHGYDPDRHIIVGGWRTSSWTAYKPKEYRRNTEDGDTDEDLGAFTFTARAYKFKVQARPQGETAGDVEALVKALDKWKPPARPKRPTVDTSAYVYAVGDTQIGKLESPTAELVALFKAHVDQAASEYRALRDRPAHVHIAWTGDCIEGVNSQGGKNRWRTVLTMTEQVRILQRLMIYAVKAFAPHCDRLTVVSVPGNHDEAFSRDLGTRSDDSWAVQALVSVQDALELSENPALQAVECYVPGPDQHGVTLEVGGAVIAHVHGHQFRARKEYEWWQGQAFGGQDEGQATVLLHGHQHHYQIEEEGHRVRICTPAMEKESVWWKHLKGTPGSPGSLIIHIEDGRPTTVRRLY